MEDIYALSDRAVELMADSDPLMATEAGITGRDHRWTDLSPTGHADRRALYEGLAAAAERTQTTTDAELLASRVLLADLKDRIAHHDSGDHLRDLNSIDSSFQSIKFVFDVMARDTPDDWSNIVSRLETIAEPLIGYRQCLETGMARSMVVARRQIEAVIEEGRGTAGDESPFLDLSDSFAAADLDDTAMGDRLTTAITTARSSFDDFTTWLEASYLPAAGQQDAVGAQRYATQARRHLGMTIDLEETYAWGWREIRQLWERIGEVCAEIDESKTISEVVEVLETDPARSAANIPEFIAAMQTLQEQALEQLTGTHFDVPSQICDIEVKISPPGGALAPYYTGPSEDYSRPGTVWYPLGTRTAFPLWGEITTGYHEGFPGHHLQVGTQLALGDQLSRYHRTLVWQPGSGEGWALYAERLMYELGYLDKPEYEMGLLAAQIMRSCRVVIDIGMHCGFAIPEGTFFHPGEQWSFDAAVEMLCEVALQTREMAESEVTRYLGWPGQAIAYKVGERVILGLRDELSQEPDFDLKAFHSKVLSLGSIGLELLEEMVRSAR